MWIILVINIIIGASGERFDVEQVRTMKAFFLALFFSVDVCSDADF